jgi:hypothetical protein
MFGNLVWSGWSVVQRDDATGPDLHRHPLQPPLQT